MLVVGKTGAGKSTLLRALLHREAVTGRAAALIDPHGDLADEVLADLPRFRRNDLVLLDPTESTCRGLNPLRGLSAGARHLVVANVLAAIRKLFPDNAWGARTEHLLRHALLAAAEVRGGTIADAARMLYDDDHRAWILRQVADPGVLGFWTREFAGYGKSFAAEAAAAPANKLGALLSSPPVSSVLTKTRPRLDMAKALARSAFVVARLSKGALGEEAARFLGGLVLGMFQSAIFARAATPPASRKRVTLVVDEATSLPETILLELLAEGRKFGASIIVATQGLAALPPDVRAGLLANAGAIVAFRVGGDDAEILNREFAGEFGPVTLTSLATGEMVVRVGASRACVTSFTAA
ncbi:MAG: type IV secretion system DNA-binding domain-containing protein [Deltaproteobacteria bacterium]|nr:type IV secretion system DNA-binding domain-containing protein [Deltaproteobacteria bacterium]